jgi:hypothetical protein
MNRVAPPRFWLDNAAGIRARAECDRPVGSGLPLDAELLPAALRARFELCFAPADATIGAHLDTVDRIIPP